MRSLTPQTGSTLMEVIIAIGLSTILFFAIAYIYELSQNSYYRADTRAELTQNGRVILDRITRELRQTSDVVTTIPENNSDPASLPSEIIFQDGHDASTIKYIHYYFDSINHEIRRQILVFYFDTDPGNYVYINATDHDGHLPQNLALDDDVVGEYVADIEFWGNQLININLYLDKNNLTEIIYTAVYGRNY